MTSSTFQRHGLYVWHDVEWIAVFSECTGALYYCTNTVPYVAIVLSDIFSSRLRPAYEYYPAECLLLLPRLGFQAFVAAARPLIGEVATGRRTSVQLRCAE